MVTACYEVLMVCSLLAPSLGSGLALLGLSRACQKFTVSVREKKKIQGVCRPG